MKVKPLVFRDAWLIPNVWAPDDSGGNSFWASYLIFKIRFMLHQVSNSDIDFPKSPILNPMNRILIPYILAITVALSFGTTVHAQDTLRVLSWNVQMLPRFVNSNGKA